MAIKFVSPKPVVGSQEADTGKHCLTYNACCHICGYKPAEGATKEEQRSLLLVNLVLADGFVNEQPLVVVDVLGLLDNISYALTVTKAPLVNCKDFEVLFSQVFSNTTVSLRIRPETVNIEHYCLPVVFGRVPVCPEFDLFAELDYREVEDVNLFEGNEVV